MIAPLVDKGLTAPSPRQQASKVLADNEILVARQVFLNYYSVADPIVQSGGTYDFRISAQSNEDNVKFDVITVLLGARYQMNCSNVVRTFLVDAPKQVTRNYKLLVSVHSACLDAIVLGRPL